MSPKNVILFQNMYKLNVKGLKKSSHNNKIQKCVQSLEFYPYTHQTRQQELDLYTGALASWVFNIFYKDAV